MPYERAQRALHQTFALRGAEVGRWRIEDFQILVSIGFTNLLHLYSPDLIVTGGGLANGFDLLAGAGDATYRDVPIVQAQLGDQAGLVGGATLILREGEPGTSLAIAQNDREDDAGTRRERFGRSSTSGMS